VDMSEWSDGGFPDPLTGRTVYGFKRYLQPWYDVDGDVISWGGVLPSGATILVRND